VAWYLANRTVHVVPESTRRGKIHEKIEKSAGKRGRRKDNEKTAPKDMERPPKEKGFSVQRVGQCQPESEVRTGNYRGTAPGGLVNCFCVVRDSASLNVTSKKRYYLNFYVISGPGRLLKKKESNYRNYRYICIDFAGWF
jgi:hypothetical protein